MSGWVAGSGFGTLPKGTLAGYFGSFPSYQNTDRVFVCTGVEPRSSAQFPPNNAVFLENRRPSNVSKSKQLVFTNSGTEPDEVFDIFSNCPCK